MEWDKRRKRVSAKLKSVNATRRVRLLVRKTGKHIYASLITPEGDVLNVLSDRSLGKRISCESAREVGLSTGHFALSKGLTSLYFDRNGYPYHGRIKALADAVREVGLEF